MHPGTSATENLLPKTSTPDGTDSEGGKMQGHEIRKVSSAGRFKIFTKSNDIAATTTKNRAETASPDTSLTPETPPAPEPIGKSVHFSVTEEDDDENYYTIGSTNMDSTLMNAKSWR
uniref:PLD phosphodiesterase domain-containing protein n=1 Tax=Panagrolaimus sp. ES5 TaxID=591445 RepID=A0AC34FVF6_9BILA